MNSKTQFIVEDGKPEVIVIRVFNAPRDLLFKIFTDAEHISKWWGPGYLTTKVEKMEVRPGGIWRFIQYDAEGREFGFHGVFHEVTAPERIINTFEFEGLPEKGHVLLETKKFEDMPDGKTRLTIQSVYQSLSDRDGMVKAGMEGGLRESMDRLEELINKEIK